MTGAAPEDPSPVTVVTGPDSGIVRRLAATLRDHGSDVVLVCPSGAAGAVAAIERHSPAGTDAGSLSGIDADPVTRPAMEAAIGAATSARRATVVLTHFDPDALTQRPMVELGRQGWARLCDLPIRHCLVALQAAHTALAPAGGSVVVVTPTLSMLGAAGYVALCASSEAQRVLAKTAARSWGRHGLTVNVVAVPVPSFADGWSFDRAGVPMDDPTLALSEAALVPGTWTGDATGTIAFLGSGAGRAVTGATICVDGGVVMA